MSRQFDARTILDLQQTVGNQCVNRLLALSSTNAEPEPEVERGFFGRLAQALRRLWVRVTRVRVTRPEPDE